MAVKVKEFLHQNRGSIAAPDWPSELSSKSLLGIPVAAYASSNRCRSAAYLPARQARHELSNVTTLEKAILILRKKAPHAPQSGSQQTCQDVSVLDVACAGLGGSRSRLLRGFSRVRT